MRLIDADALVKDLNTIWFKDRGNCLDVFSCVKEAPTIAGWIPCSERLPEYREVVLITNDKGNVRYGQFRGTRGKYWHWKGNTLEEVIAWMPLPPAYEGDK